MKRLAQLAVLLAATPSAAAEKTPVAPLLDEGST